MNFAALARGLLATAVGLAAFTVPVTATAYAADDPCNPAKGQSAPPACAAAAKGQQAITNCPPTSAKCMQSLAGTGEEPLQLIARTGTDLTNFENKTREIDPNTAAGDLCSIATSITSQSKPGEHTFPPSWWYC
ncbi:hypothetical protein [Streptomyces sp. L2]|uniref:hypothetical protein n=1 Tax=Streptomyces sp. L2 TaxID=2162665 RepID=UPI001012A8B1|nr:hypothetical protein [Streptomyces sp. L2]